MELWTTWYTGQNSLATKIITMKTVKGIRYEDSYAAKSSIRKESLYDTFTEIFNILNL
jgi:hypothetical protein